ncbi:unnamed protein product, partial [Prorocentrum cordatum]
AVGWRDREEGNANLAHIAAQRSNPAMLEALVQHGVAGKLFAEKRGSVGPPHSGDGFTPAHDCAHSGFDFIYDNDGSSWYKDPAKCDHVSARAECLRVLHKGLVQHFSPLLATLASSSGTGFGFAPAVSDASAAIIKSCELRDLDASELSPAEMTVLPQLMDVFLDVGGLKDIDQFFNKAPRAAVNALNKKVRQVEILFSTPKYLGLQTRAAWLRAAMEAIIPPEDGEGIVLEVANWEAPLLGACEALGVASEDGRLTTARPAKLQTVRQARSARDAAAGDGLRRQWLAAAASQLLEPDHGLFVLSADGTTLVPNPHSGSLVPDHLAQFALLGRILGLALLHGEPLCPEMGRLNLAFLGLLFGRSVDEHAGELLDYLDPAARRQMHELQMLAKAGGDVADLCLTFSLAGEPLPAYLARPGRRAQPAESDMKPGGTETLVENHSLNEYVRLRSLSIVRSFSERIGAQLAAAAGGLAVLLPPLLAGQVRGAFAPDELRLLLGGAGEINDAAVDDWEANTTYQGGLTALRGFGPADRARVLEFAVGSASAPPLGFARLPGG